MTACLECGSRTDGFDFCGGAHRKAWNNRRMVRGAELYDLFMALRYDRAAAVKLRVWKALCRLGVKYRDEDYAERAGRASWRPPARVLDRHPYLAATSICDNVTGARR